MIDSTMLDMENEVFSIITSNSGTNKEVNLNTLTFCNQSLDEVVVSLWLVDAANVPEDLNAIDDLFMTIHQRTIPASDTWYYTRADAIALRYGDRLLARIDSGVDPKVSVSATSSFANDR